MRLERAAPGPCVLCGEESSVRRRGAWWCVVCGWRAGDVPDLGLAPPRLDVVYYLAYAERIKIGTTGDPRQRLRAVRHDTLLAFERGDRALEHRRHEEFAAIREGGEWFTATAELRAHAATLAGGVDPWHTYARWRADDLRRLL